MRKIVFTLLVIVWMGVIFTFSSQNGNDSTKTSDSLVNKIVIVIEKIQHKKYNDEERFKVAIIVRKTAHFTEYFILAVLVFLMLKEYKVSYIYLWTILVCFIYASTDEIHQLFISKRAGQVIDVIIDTCGSIVAVLIMQIIEKRMKKNGSVK